MTDTLKITQLLIFFMLACYLTRFEYPIWLLLCYNWLCISTIDDTSLKGFESTNIYVFSHSIVSCYDCQSIRWFGCTISSMMILDYWKFAVKGSWKILVSNQCQIPYQEVTSPWTLWSVVRRWAHECLFFIWSLYLLQHWQLLNQLEFTK
jgi:hypothetical protein